MKMKDLVPEELLTAVTNTIKGTLTVADKTFLKEKCQIEFKDKDLVFYQDGTVDVLLLENNLIKEIEIYRPDEELFEGFCDETHYLKNAFLVVLAKLCSDLPPWVSDFSKLHINSFYLEHSLSDLSLPEIENAYDQAWEMVFSGKSPGWRDGLRRGILPAIPAATQIMLTIMSSAKLPSWLYDGIGYPTLEVGTLMTLEKLYERDKNKLSSNSDLPDESQETYISPFSGKPV